MFRKERATTGSSTLSLPDARAISNETAVVRRARGVGAGPRATGKAGPRPSEPRGKLRPRGGRGERVARGLYADSWFYPARGLFHLFNTCNTWTARMLSAAGVGASLSGVNTADDLMGRLRDLASVKQLIQD